MTPLSFPWRTDAGKRLERARTGPAALPGGSSRLRPMGLPPGAAFRGCLPGPASPAEAESPARWRWPGRHHAGTVRPMTPDDDGELMLRYARGDMRAFETLYGRNRIALYRYLVKHTRNPETANDLFQEVWGKVIATRDRYEPKALFRTFLYRIAHNCFIDHYRRSSVRNESTDTEDGWENALPGPEQDQPDARAEQAEMKARYQAALSRLPPEQRDVFLLYESGLSLEEIANISAVGAETAKSRLRYAVAKLRASLAPVDETLPTGVGAIQERGA
jgi:RNA polymerase sigma-70 factor, ECF subfamily